MSSILIIFNGSINSNSKYHSNSQQKVSAFKKIQGKEDMGTFGEIF